MGDERIRSEQSICTGLTVVLLSGSNCVFVATFGPAASSRGVLDLLLVVVEPASGFIGSCSL